MIVIGKDLKGQAESVDGFDCTVRLWKMSDGFWFLNILDEEGNDVIVNFLGVLSVGVRQIRAAEQRDEADGELAGKAPNSLSTEDK